MKYIVASTAVMDELRFADGTMHGPVGGGAGLYALAGMKTWTDDVLIVTGVGSDFAALQGEWFARNHLSTAGLVIKGEYTPRTTVAYDATDERTETPIYGSDHYRLMEPAPAEIEQACQEAAGVYVFKNADRDFWSATMRLKERQGFMLLWELAADAAQPRELPGIVEILKHVDVWSLNRQEALDLFAATSVVEVIPRLHALRLPLVYLRMGREGAYMLAAGKTWTIPSIRASNVVDVTGGGNSSSGAVLVGFCEGNDPLMAGIMGSVSAAACLAQYGPPPVIDAVARENAKWLARAMYDEYRRQDDAI